MSSKLWLLLAGVAVFLTACGGGGASSEESSEVLAAAEQNQAQLTLTENLAQTELLDGESGQITNLDQVITGDRPVLLWYWAPN